MNQEILKILYSYAREVTIKSAILAEEEREEWIWSGNFEALAKELEEYAEKQFDFSKHCTCEVSIGQTWCCNLCGLPYIPKTKGG